jgi:ammonium transporter Rh
MEAVNTVVLKTVDQGGCVLVHVFGCYFGLAVSSMIPKKQRQGARGEKPSENDEDSVYRSDFFSLLGTAFLWIFLPSFNGALAVGGARSRAVVNTILSCAASCCCTFYTSRLLRSSFNTGCLQKLGTGEDRINIREIQSATIAGGVAASSVASQLVQPWVAVLMGSMAGALATLGHIHLQGLLLGHLGVHDTTGVHNRHGLPGLLGMVVGIIATFNVGSDIYGDNPSVVFPEMGSGRSATKQGSLQMAALAVGLACAVSGGLITGLIIRIPFFEPVHAPFLDDPYWVIPGEENQYPSSVNTDPDDIVPEEEEEAEAQEDELESKDDA